MRSGVACGVRSATHADVKSEAPPPAPGEQHRAAAEATPPGTSQVEPTSTPALVIGQCRSSSSWRAYCVHRRRAC